MDYTALVGDKDTVGSIKYWANWGRLDSESILDEAQKFIYSSLRVMRMVQDETIPIAQGATAVAFPDRYLDPVVMTIPSHQMRVKYWDQERFKTRLGYDSDGALPVAMPTVWTRIGEQMQFNTQADQAYSGKFTFFQAPAPLSGANPTNWLTDEYPTLVRRVCLMYAFEERKEYDAMDRAELKALAEIEQIKVDSDLEMRGMKLDFNWSSDEED